LGYSVLEEDDVQGMPEYTVKTGSLFMIIEVCRDRGRSSVILKIAVQI